MYFPSNSWISKHAQRRFFNSAWTTATIEGALKKHTLLPPLCQREEADPWPVLSFNLSKRPTLYIVATSKVALVMEYLEGTMTHCPDKVSPGAFHPDNSIVFMLLGASNTSSFLSNSIIVNDIFSYHNILVHGQVAMMMATQKPNFLVYWRYNIYTNSTVQSAYRFGGSKSLFTNVLFSPYDMEVGYYVFFLNRFNLKIITPAHRYFIGQNKRQK